MTHAEVLDAMNAIALRARDEERDHSEADDLLCSALISLGYADVVAVYGPHRQVVRVMRRLFRFGEPWSHLTNLHPITAAPVLYDWATECDEAADDAGLERVGDGVYRQVAS